MESQIQGLKRLLRRQLLLIWVAVGSAWAYAFTLVGEASWNLGWTVVLWFIFTLGFTIIGVTTLNQTETLQAEIGDRISTLETRVDDLETESTD